MSEFTAMRDAIKKQYGFDAWSDAAAPNLEASPMAFGPLPSAQKSSSFMLERRVELPEDRFAVTILQNQTVQQAHEELVEELSTSMAPSLPRAEEKDIHVGHIAFAGHGTIQTAVKFVRGNLFVKVESVGTTQADVKELAEAIDKEMLSHLGG
jgi:hypothetical protein